MRVDKTLETKPLSSLRCTGPVKQKRALLESNPPRDSWTEGDEMHVSTSGEAQTSPDAAMQSFIYEPSHTLKTHPKNKLKISLSQYPFFRSKRIATGWAQRPPGSRLSRRGRSSGAKAVD